MSAEKSEVQNLNDPEQAAEGLDNAPPASDTGHVSQGEPRDYTDEKASDDDREGPRTQRSHDA